MSGRSRSRARYVRSSEQRDHRSGKAGSFFEYRRLLKASKSVCRRSGSARSRCSCLASEPKTRRTPWLSRRHRATGTQNNFPPSRLPVKPSRVCSHQLQARPLQPLAVLARDPIPSRRGDRPGPRRSPADTPHSAVSCKKIAPFPAYIEHIGATLRGRMSRYASTCAASWSTICSKVVPARTLQLAERSPYLANRP